LYRSEHGCLPESLWQLEDADCVPGIFNEGDFTCPEGGNYVLADDCLTGVSDIYGRADCLTPCCDLPKPEATPEEVAAVAEQFKAGGLIECWRNPIALRLRLTAKRLHVEAFTPPVAEKETYDLLLKIFGGAPEHLDTLPVPKRNLFSINISLNKA